MIILFICLRSEMETHAMTVFNGMNPKEHRFLGMPWLCEAVLCGSSKSAGCGPASHSVWEVLMVCFWQKGCGKGELPRF
jgi:hypothetical protein